MKTKTLFLACAFLSLQVNSLFAQVTDPANMPSSTNSFLGWDATTNQDLNIKHEGAYPIIFSTDQSERMRLNEDGQLLIGLSTPIVPNASRLEVYSQNTSTAITARADGGSEKVA